MARASKKPSAAAKKRPPRKKTIPVRLSLGRGSLPASLAAALDVGCVVELDSDADEHIELYAGQKLAARGEAVTVKGKLGICVRELPATGDR